MALLIFLLVVSAEDCEKVPLSSRLTLSNGVELPMLGFGTAGLQERSRDAIGRALEVGYELIDTAAQVAIWYRNEDVVGELTESMRPRPFVTTKLHPQDHGTEASWRAINESLRNLRTDTLDAVLFHYAECWSGAACEHEAEGTWRDSWRVLERLYDAGVVRVLGVCNFHPPQLRELLAFARIKPHLMQTHFDPLSQATAVRELCAQHNIAFQAYSTLGTQHRPLADGSNRVLAHHVIRRIARAHSRSPAQITLRWATQHNVSVIPRSANPAHIAENAHVFDFKLTEEEMKEIDGMGR